MVEPIPLTVAELLASSPEVAERLTQVTGKPFPEATIRTWKSRGAIPQKRWGDIVAAYPRLTLLRLAKMHFPQET